MAAALGTAGSAGWAFDIPALKGAVSDTEHLCSIRDNGVDFGMRYAERYRSIEDDDVRNSAFLSLLRAKVSRQ